MRFSSFLLAATAFALPGLAHAGEVEGKVMDASGLPASGLEVLLGEQVTLTDADGAYAFADVVAGEASVAVRRADGSLQRVWVEVAQQGTSRRNIFLLAAAAVDNALGSLLAQEAEEEALEETYELAESLSQKAAQRETTDWQWRDLDA